MRRRPPAASDVSQKTAPAPAPAVKSADAVPMPRSKPQTAATFQLASADAQIVQPGKPKQVAAAPA